MKTKRIITLVLVLGIAFAFASPAMAGVIWEASSVYIGFNTASQNWPDGYSASTYKYENMHFHAHRGDNQPGKHGIYYDGVKNGSNWHWTKGVNAAGTVLTKDGELSNNKYDIVVDFKMAYSGAVIGRIDKPAIGSNVKMETYGYWNLPRLVYR